MKKILALFASVSFLSCSGPEVKVEQVPAVPPVPPPSQAVAPGDGNACSESLSKLVEQASKISYIGVVARGQEASRQRCLFNLRDPEVLKGACKELMDAAGTCRIVFRKDNKECVSVCEWTFAGSGQAGKVQDAITAPLSEEQKKAGYERFYSNPFTFWQYENRLYYLYSMEEAQRADMDKLNELLTSVLGPRDKLY